MAAQVVITQPTASTPSLGGLFTNLSFFLVQRLPSRSTFISRIHANGGRVVKLEQQADHIIADHFRNDCPAGSISYTFIDAAIRSGILPDPAEHATRVPRGVAREAGSGAPVKGTRTAFTAEDDRVLWDWVKRSGGAAKGNEVYKQLEQVNARHTWQAWRDRYVKRLAGRPPAGVRVVVEANAPPSPPSAPDEEVEIRAENAGVDEARQVGQEVGEELAQDEDKDGAEEEQEADFTKEEVDSLLDQGQDIESIDEDREEEAWNAWAQAYPSHSAHDWRQFWKERVRPIYLKRKKVEERQQEKEWKNVTVEDESDKEDEEDADELAPSESEKEAAQALRSSPRKQKRPAGITVKDGSAEVTFSEGEPDSAASVPPSSQKRKRPAFVSPAQRTYGRKKRKSASDDVIGQAESEDELAATPKASDQRVTTSELNRPAQTQLSQESSLSPRAAALVQDTFRQTQSPLRQESGVSSEQALPTSELNRQAQAQLRQEAGVSSEDALAAREAVEQVPSQLRQESGWGSEDLAVQESIEDPYADAQAAFDEEVLGFPRTMQPAVVQTVSNLQMSDVNRAADRQLTQESLQQGNEDDREGDDSWEIMSVAASPEADEDEEASVQDLVVPQELREAAAQDTSDLPTSDMNQAADRQLTQESLERRNGDNDGAEQDRSNELERVSASSEDDGESIQSQEDRAAPADNLEIASAPLTEANLASQQAQHKAPLLRGADLPEDSEAQDGEQQDEFARYLQGLTGRTSAAEAVPPATYETQASVAVESRIPRDDPPRYEEFDSGDLLLSSQQEIDQVMDDMLQWPDSPVASQRRVVPESLSQSMQFETQIPYPTLPAQPPIDSQFEEEMVSSQPSMVAEVSYPTLPQEEEEEESVSARQPSGRQKQREEEDEESLVESSGSISSEQGVEEQEQDDLDLSVPAPLDGWSSSPLKPQSSQATPLARRQQVRIKQEPNIPESSPARSQVAVTSQQEVLEISSTSSSSSSSSEHDDEEAGPDSPRVVIVQRALETQDILNAETQPPDFDLPLPPDSPRPSSSASNRSSPHPHPDPTTAESQRALAETQTLADEDLDTYITTQATLHGYTDAAIIAALKCTSMRPELAELVLVEEKLGRGVPGDVAGVWSEEEDRVLESGDARALRGLERKHGWGEMEARMAFLEEWREGDEDAE